MKTPIIAACLWIAGIMIATGQPQHIVHTNDIATLPEGFGEPISIFQATDVTYEIAAYTNGSQVSFTGSEAAIWEVFKVSSSWLMAVTNCTIAGNRVTFQATVSDTTIPVGTYRYTARTFGVSGTNPTATVIGAGGFRVNPTPYGSIPGRDASNGVNIHHFSSTIITGATIAATSGVVATEIPAGGYQLSADEPWFSERYADLPGYLAVSSRLTMLEGQVGSLPDDGISDAPSNGTLYARQDAAWLPVPDQSTGIASNAAGIASNSAALGLRLTDAPSNGSQYARRDGAWSPVDSGGGSAEDWSIYPATNTVEINTNRLDDVTEIRGVGSEYLGQPVDLILRPVSAGGPLGDVSIGSGAALSAEHGYDTVLTAKTGQLASVHGHDAATGGQAGGNVSIRGGRGSGDTNGVVMIQDAVTTTIRSMLTDTNLTFTNGIVINVYVQGSDYSLGGIAGHRASYGLGGGISIGTHRATAAGSANSFVEFPGGDRKGAYTIYDTYFGYPYWAVNIVDSTTATTNVAGTAYRAWCHFSSINPYHAYNIDKRSWPLYLYGTGAAPVMSLDAANNRLGVMTTSPSYPLDVAGAARVRYTLYMGTLGDYLAVDGTNLFYHNATGAIAQVTSF